MIKDWEEQQIVKERSNKYINFDTYNVASACNNTGSLGSSLSLSY